MDASGSLPDATATLPDDLLGAVIGLAGQEAGPSTTLVCKRWHRLFWEEGSAWRRVRLDCDSLVFSPATRLASLAKLSLHGEVGTATAASLVQCPNLTELTLSGCAQHMLGMLHALPVLPRLQSLTVKPYIELSASRPSLAAVQRQLDRFPALLSWELSNMWFWNSGSGIKFGNVALGEINHRKSGPKGAQNVDLLLERYPGQPLALWALLDALLPDGSRLDRLSLYNFELSAADLQPCPALEQLSVLRLGNCTCSTCLPAALGPLLGKATGLTELDLSRPYMLAQQQLWRWLGAIPPSLAQLRGLRKLALHAQHLTELPEGSMWPGLEALDLSANDLGPGLPPALVSATALTSLLLHRNAKLALTEADVAGVLAGMPRLRVLDLRRTAGLSPEALDHLRSSLPLIELWL
ncbi:hypothetical protein ABPG75_006821 [Micractinium tetrahymenae]